MNFVPVIHFLHAQVQLRALRKTRKRATEKREFHLRRGKGAIQERDIEGERGGSATERHVESSHIANEPWPLTVDRSGLPIPGHVLIIHPNEDAGKLPKGVFYMGRGGIVKDLRNALSLTQNQLGAMLDVSRQTISDWECGRSFPKSRRAQIEALHASKVRDIFTKE